MTRKDLEQLKMLKLEIKTLSEEISRAEKSTVVDVVIGSRLSIPYDAHPIIVQGVSSAKVSGLYLRLNRRCDELQDRLYEIEEWIESLPDPETRVIVRLYYRNGLTQEDIGRELGYSRQRIGQKLNSFIENIKD